MSVFKINKKDMDKMLKELPKDVGMEIRDALRDALIREKSYYDRVAKTIVYEDTPDGGVVGSDEFAAAAIDHGTDWTWQYVPPINKIIEWIIRHKDPAKFGHEQPSAPSSALKSEAYMVAKSIKKNGLKESTWYVKNTLNIYNKQVERE